MIVIIDYGMGNVMSIYNMIHHIGGKAIISSDPEQIKKAKALILPGVGAFDNAINKISETGLDNVIRERVIGDKTPFLGICLGMQLLFNSSEEGTLAGLGFVPGVVKKFKFNDIQNDKLKVPHMRWNEVHPTANISLFSDFDSSPRFYFVHSYHVVCEVPDHSAAFCRYGYNFTCAIKKDNIFAVQFHPEKSHKFGMQLFNNFLKSI
jgi:glutamine amidotransferase